MMWKTPDGYSDPDGQWTSEANAYDGDPNTYATGNIPPQWGAFIYLTFSTPIQANKLQLMLAAPSTNRTVDVDVKVDGAWINVFQGAYALWEDTWMEKTFSQGSVDQVRIRFQNGYTWPVNCYIREVEVWEVSDEPPPPPEKRILPPIYAGVGTAILGFVWLRAV